MPRTEEWSAAAGDLRARAKKWLDRLEADARRLRAGLRRAAARRASQGRARPRPAQPGGPAFAAAAAGPVLGKEVMPEQRVAPARSAGTNAGGVVDGPPAPGTVLAEPPAVDDETTEIAAATGTEPAAPVAPRVGDAAGTPDALAWEAVAPTVEPERAGRRQRRRRSGLLLLAVLILGGLLRAWEIDATGLNSDEAVYAGQGASIAGNEDLAPYFPTFRAHPLLFQTLVSVGFHIGSPEVFGRLAAGALGLLTVWVIYLLGKELYGRRTGLVAALIMALMPYHVVVTRQILLDGPMVFCATGTLFLFARYARTQHAPWLYAAAAAMGATILAKEGSVILLASAYAFLALTPAIRTRWGHIAGSLVAFGVVISAFPLALMIAGATKTGGNFLAWQLFRRPNHEWTFYPTVVPVAIGVLVVLAAALGLWLLRHQGSWRETLLLAWIAVPVAFFQLFPVKGFQYLLPIAPPLALLAARFLCRYDFAALAPRRRWRRLIAPALIGVVALSLAVPSWSKVQPSTSDTFLAGSGGVPGGREAGLWIAENVPVGARMMSVGPSMANILQFYGHRKIYGLSVSPNPLHRNPVYEPMKNPDRLIRDNELQYVVWDAFSADRSPFFSQKLLRYVERYHGRAVHTETVPVTTPSGRTARKPVITIYEVRP